MPGFGYYESLFSQINPGPPSASAQANWLAGAAEARQLAEELRRSLTELQHHWSGQAASEYTTAMEAMIEYATGLADDMTAMNNGLASMAAAAASMQPQAQAVIAWGRSNKYARAQATVQLRAMVSQLSSNYQSDRGSHWKNPKEPPAKIPKADGDEDAPPPQEAKPPPQRESPILGTIREIAETAQAVHSAYKAFSSDSFPSGVTGEIPGGNGPGGESPGEIPGGGGGGEGPGGEFPSPDDPDYQPLPESDSGGLAQSPVQLASAAPPGVAGAPPVAPATGGGPGMAAPGGAMPMGGMGMGMGAAGAGGGSKPGSSGGAGPRPGGAGGGGLFGPGAGGARHPGGSSSSDGKSTWLTEDELVWDADSAPSGVVGR